MALSKVFLGLSVVAFASAGVVVARAPSRESVGARPAPTARVMPPTVTPRELAPVLPPTASSVATAPPVATAPSSRVAPSPLPSAQRSQLADEVAALGRAQASLEAGRAAEALGLLDEYARGFKSPHLRPEADAMRIEAIVATGDTALARKTLERFRLEHPGSPLLRHLEAVVPP